MYGAIAGDIIGSRFEFNNHRSKTFELFTRENHFTDDTVCTIATMDWLINGEDRDYASYLRKWCRRYPNAGYSGDFHSWVRDEKKGPYGSHGNGSAMRVSHVGIVGAAEGYVMAFAKANSKVTHNHDDAIKGAQAIAMSVMMGRHHPNKEKIRKTIEELFGYDLSYNYNDLVKNNKFDVRSKTTVPLAIYCFLKGESFEDTVRTAVSIGGDTDTISSMAGAIAEAYFGIPDEIMDNTVKYLPDDMIKVLYRFKKLIDKREKEKEIAMRRFMLE